MSRPPTEMERLFAGGLRHDQASEKKLEKELAALLGIQLNLKLMPFMKFGSGWGREPGQFLIERQKEAWNVYRMSNSFAE